MKRRGVTRKRPSKLLDGFLDSYVSWREACEQVRDAYDHWRRSPVSDRGQAYAAYSAALEREGFAADIHSSWATRLGERRAARVEHI